MKLIKLALIATAFVFAAGCASQKPAPAPQEPVATTAPVDMGVVKHKKHGKKHHHNIVMTTYQSFKNNQGVEGKK